MRLPIVGVMGSGAQGHRELAEPLGRLVAQSGCHLLTGGGEGAMAIVSEAFCHVAGRRGLSIGVIRAQSADPWAAAPVNPWVELPILTHLPLSGAQGTDPLSRNHINVLSSDFLVALPGGPGTLSEVELRLQYGRPVLLFLGGKTIDGHSVGELLDMHPASPLLTAANSIEQCRRELLGYLQEWMVRA
jgi:uncharacterized protein (TIGR00725 family)